MALAVTHQGLRLMLEHTVPQIMDSLRDCKVNQTYGMHTDQRVALEREPETGPPGWMVIRRSLRAKQEIKYFKSKAPANTPSDVVQIPWQSLAPMVA